MSRGIKRTRGFSLVELIIVVVILAILAAVIIPQFGNTTGDAKISALKATLQTVRSQLEMYKIQHNEKYPVRATWSDQMLKKTKEDGTLDIANGKYGPYLMQLPANPMDNLTTLGASQDAAGGWAYDDTTGSFKSNDSTVTSGSSKTKDL